MSDDVVGEIKIGDLVPMKSFTSDNGFCQLSFKKQKDDKRYLFVLLGAATPDQMRQNPALGVKLIERLGWLRLDDLDGLVAQIEHLKADKK